MSTYLALSQRLQDAGQIDWERASLDSVSVPAPGRASRPARIQPIAASWERSAISWSTAMVCRWRRPSREPMCTTPTCWKRRLMRSRHCGSRTGGGDDPQASGEAACRQGLRLPAAPTGAARTGRHPAVRPARHRITRAPRAVSLGQRAHAFVGQPLPPPQCALRAAGRHPSGVPLAGMRPRLLEDPELQTGDQAR